MILDVSDWDLHLTTTDVMGKIRDLAFSSQGIVVEVTRKDFMSIVNYPDSCWESWKDFLRVENGYRELPEIFLDKLTSKRFRFLSIDWKIIEEECE